MVVELYVSVSPEQYNVIQSHEIQLTTSLKFIAVIEGIIKKLSQKKRYESMGYIMVENWFREIQYR